MKFSYFGLFLFSALLFISCGDDDDNGGNGDSNDKFECTIDGTSHKISGQYAWAAFVGSGEDLFAIYGSEDQTQSGGFQNVFLSFDGGKPTVGTHEMGLGKKAIGTILNTRDNTTFISGLQGGGGSIEITEISDSRVKGTFSFTAVSTDGSTTKKVENGTFDVRIGF